MDFDTMTKIRTRCESVEGPHIDPGWACHECNVYNGLQRQVCKQCGHTRCKPLAPDSDTGRVLG